MIVDVGIQLTDALESAHRKGIIHRDIKPENIFITMRGIVKLLDFGIAKLSVEQAAATATVTRTHVGTGPVALGTIAYMSPEQVRGESLDWRTDLFSLGVVLYEMATGQQPFRGKTSGAVLGEILTKAPTAPEQLNADVPSELQRIVNKLLDKDRELRYQSAREVRVDLERLRRTCAPPAAESAPADVEEASIVVLPFDNLSPDPENAFFADGLTEEVIADLSKIRALRVISRTSAMLLKGSRKDVPTIAREVNVRYVLEGSVRRAGNHLRITAQLIDAKADAHVWAEKFTGTLDDVFDLQETLSRCIVDVLKLTLTGDERRRLAARAIPNVQALDCYLRARQEMYATGTEPALERATALVDRALGTVGPNALLYALHGEIQYLYHDQGIRADDETLGRAASQAERALDLAPDCGAAFRVKGLVAFRRADAVGGIEALRTALGLERNSDTAMWLAYVEAETGLIADAERHATLALAMDPLFWGGCWARAFVALLAGQFDPAIAFMRRAVTLGADAPLLYAFLGIMSAYAGRRREAIEALARADGAALGPRMAALVYSGMLRGDTAAIISTIGDTSFRDYARQDKEISWWLADACAQTGLQDEALGWLANAIDLGLINHRFLAQIDPFLAPLRGTPRFEALVERCRAAARALNLTLSRPRITSM